MTAVVGILNKTGVAIAADSAVTVGNVQGSKVYNTANKIFMLSKYHPVGIVIYNSAEFMGIPWEIIIKEYRKELGETCFDTVRAYQEHFIEWMKERNFFHEDTTPFILENEMSYFLMGMFSQYLKEGEELDSTKTKAIVEYYKSETIGKEVILNMDKSESFSLLRKAVHISRSFVKTVQCVQEDMYDISKEMSRMLFDYMTKDIFGNYTGLVFVGYGDRELFPNLLSMKASIAISKKTLRYKVDKVHEINHTHPSAVVPFAQEDVISTILKGVSPVMLRATSDVFEGFLENFVQISRKMKTADLSNFSEEQIKATIKVLGQAYREGLSKKMDENHYQPMLRTISHLGKEDLVEMAESLIYMTYLNRRFTMQEESVGGPVDVALITKGDGFVWMKRKHYFEAENNHHFFKNYYPSNHE